MVLYLTYWFPSNRRARMMAFLIAGNPISGIVGGPLSGYILHYFAHGTRIAGWQWLFIIESIPALVLGVVLAKKIRPIESCRYADTPGCLRTVSCKPIRDVISISSCMTVPQTAIPESQEFVETGRPTFSNP